VCAVHVYFPTISTSAAHHNVSGPFPIFRHSRNGRVRQLIHLGRSRICRRRSAVWIRSNGSTGDPPISAVTKMGRDHNVVDASAGVRYALGSTRAPRTPIRTVSARCWMYSGWPTARGQCSARNQRQAKWEMQIGNAEGKSPPPRWRFFCLSYFIDQAMLADERLLLPYGARCRPGCSAIPWLNTRRSHGHHGACNTNDGHGVSGGGIRRSPKWTRFLRQTRGQKALISIGRPVIGTA